MRLILLIFRTLAVPTQKNIEIWYAVSGSIDSLHNLDSFVKFRLQRFQQVSFFSGAGIIARKCFLSVKVISIFFK